MKFDLQAMAQRIDYLLVHETSIWLLVVLFGTALASWHLANILTAHNARTREAALARKTAIAYAATAAFLWLYSLVMS